jgi:hypothetical protein
MTYELKKIRDQLTRLDTSLSANIPGFKVLTLEAINEIIALLEDIYRELDNQYLATKELKDAITYQQNLRGNSI